MYSVEFISSNIIEHLYFDLLKRYYFSFLNLQEIFHWQCDRKYLKPNYVIMGAGWGGVSEMDCDLGVG